VYRVHVSATANNAARSAPYSTGGCRSFYRCPLARAPRPRVLFLFRTRHVTSPRLADQTFDTQYNGDSLARGQVELWCENTAPAADVVPLDRASRSNLRPRTTARLERLIKERRSHCRSTEFDLKEGGERTREMRPSHHVVDAHQRPLTVDGIHQS